MLRILGEFWLVGRGFLESRLRGRAFCEAVEFLKRSVEWVNPVDVIRCFHVILLFLIRLY